jgi:hypothetical protein
MSAPKFSSGWMDHRLLVRGCAMGFCEQWISSQAATLCKDAYCANSDVALLSVAQRIVETWSANGLVHTMGSMNLCIDGTEEVAKTLEALFGEQDVQGELRNYVFVRGRDQKDRLMVQTIAVASVWRLVMCPTTSSG